MGIQMNWHDSGRKLDLELAPGSRLLGSRSIEVQLQGITKKVTFAGKTISVSFDAS
jgi:hypothetical protein